MYLICELEDGSTSLNTCSKLAAAYCFFFCITFAMLQTEKKWTTCTSINFYSMLLQYAFLWNVPFHIFSVDAWSVLAMKLWIYCPAGVIVNAIWNEDSFWYVCTLNTLMAIFVAYWLLLLLFALWQSFSFCVLQLFSQFYAYSFTCLVGILKSFRWHSFTCLVPIFVAKFCMVLAGFQSFCCLPPQFTGAKFGLKELPKYLCAG